MSNELFEIAFSGVIKPGADPEVVKQKVGQIFKADENRLAQMFSGKRMIIKRQADAATAAKYRGAFEKAGAICEVKELTSQNETAATAIPGPTSATAVSETAKPAAGVNDSGADYVSRYPESEQIPQALLTDPLGISGDNIQELGADIAPVGSMMQQAQDVPEPAIDISGMDIAPVGSDLSSGKQEAPPPPPDISGLSLADEGK
jgi:hypothetical protein